MNDAELDALAKRAATTTRAEARAIADSDAALRQLLAGQAAVPAQPLAPVVPYHGPIRDADWRRRWVFVAAAAVLALVVGSITWAAFTGDATIEIADGPLGGTGTGPSLGTSAPAAPASSSPSPSSTPDTSPATSIITIPTTEITVPTTAPAVQVPPSVIVPEMEPFPLDALPRLLPQPAPAADRTYRFEGVSDPTPPTLSQLWVRADGAGSVDAILSMTTRTGPVGRSGTPRPIDVPGWGAGRAWDMAPGYVDIEVAGVEFVEIWARGLGEDEVVAIAAGLVGGGSTWRSDVLDDAPWTSIQSEWSMGIAQRGLVTLDTEGDVDSELTIMHGAALMDASAMLQLSDELRLVDVGGRPGLLGRPGASGLVFVHTDQTMVEIASRDPEADLIAIAATLVAVDAQAWDAAAAAAPPDRDGCISLFC